MKTLISLARIFEQAGTIKTGTGNDIIKLSPSASTSNGTIDGGAGNDVLVVDFSSISNTQGVQNDGTKVIVPGISTLTNYSNIENFNITGSNQGDNLSGKAGDILDGAGGVDKLNLDFSTATTNVNIDLTQVANQVNFGSTQVKNFEQAGTIKTGTGNNIIKLSPSASTSNGTIDGGAGNDVLVVDFSSISNTQGVQNDGTKVIVPGISTLTNYSNIENFNITGSNQGDNLVGFTGNDTLDGNGGNDTITAGDGSDVVIGGTGNDNLNGGAGNDRIIGTNPYSATPGINEIDTLAGGTGSDTFMLGNATNVFYDDGNTSNAGTGNYARITDFNPSQDIIQLNGSKSNYFLGVSPISGISGTAIYLNKPGTEPDELIAIIEGVTGLDINASAFVEAKDEIAFSDAQFSVNEDGTPVAIVTVTRSIASLGNVSATLNLSNGTATAGEDYTNNSPIAVSFAEGENSKTIIVPITDDSLVESNETINLTLTNPTGGAILGAQNTATLTIFDNETTGTLAFSNANYSVNEDGTSVIAVTVTRTGGSDGQVGASILLNNGTATAPTHILHQYTRTSISCGQNVRKRAQNNICENSEHHSPVCPSSTLHIDGIDA